MRKEIMLDLETMGSNSPNSAIVAIGAVKMDMDVLKLEQMPPEVPEFVDIHDLFVVESFYAVISLADCQRHGLVIEGDTVMWWLKQSEEARKALYEPGFGTREGGEPYSLAGALQRYSIWAREGALDDATLPHWGNGSDFDCTLLRNAYNAVEFEVPWRYHQSRCFRTLKNLVPKEKLAEFEPPNKEAFTPHNAVHDAHKQAYMLFNIARHLKLEL